MRLIKRWNHIPFSPEKIPFFYGWVILFATIIGALVSAPGQTIGVSAFTDYLIGAIGISRNQISTAYMIGTIGSSFVLTWAGRKYDKYGARWTGMVASLILAFVLLLLSQSDRIIRFLVSNDRETLYSAVSISVMVFLFFLLRFSGQGVVSMVSRNMLMKWFIARRGLVNGIASVFIALGFSLAPLTFDGIIQASSWRMAWLVMAGGIGLFFTLFVFVLFRDNPEDLKMIPDGEKHGHREHDVTIRAFKQFSLREARKTLIFWLYALPLAIYALYITGFTFHLISIFENAGMDRDKALAIFIPISFLSVGFSFLGGWISDRIRLKYLLYTILAGELIALLSLGSLRYSFAYFAFIVGHGIASGLHNLLMTITWPRFFGRKHLGEISGFVMSLVVFSSALGPVIFSFSYTKLGGYVFASLAFAFLVILLLIFSHKGNNPQNELLRGKAPKYQMGFATQTYKFPTQGSGY